MIGMKIEIDDLYTKSGLYTLRIIGETLLKLLMLVKRSFSKSFSDIYIGSLQARDHVCWPSKLELEAHGCSGHSSSLDACGHGRA